MTNEVLPCYRAELTLMRGGASGVAKLSTEPGYGDLAICDH